MTATCRLLGLACLAACGPPAADETTQLSPVDEVKIGQVGIEYFAHAAFRIRSPGGRQVVIDPYADRVWLGYDFPDGVEADAILITHPHYDRDAGDRMGRPFPWGVETPAFRDPGTYEVGDITIHGVRGKHADPYGKEFGQINTLFSIGGCGTSHRTPWRQRTTDRSQRS